MGLISAVGTSDGGLGAGTAFVVAGFGVMGTAWTVLIGTGGASDVFFVRFQASDPLGTRCKPKSIGIVKWKRCDDSKFGARESNLSAKRVLQSPSKKKYKTLTLTLANLYLARKWV
jgi:hypothetical protein